VSTWQHTGAAQRTVVGPGAVAELGALARQVGARRALVVTSPGRVAAGAAARVERALGRAHVATVAAAEPHVPAAAVQTVAAAARAESADLLVALGGGSAIDGAKAAAFFVEQQSGAPGVGYADRPALPVIAVPTTLVGASWTRWFAMVDPHGGRAQLAEGPTTAPLAAVVDDELVDLPPALLAATAVAALAHGIEAAWSPGRSPEAEAVAVAGVSRIGASLGRAVADPTDGVAIADLRDGAVLCARALAAARPGLAHALAGLLGARARVPYGVAQAAVLGPVARFTADVLGPEGAAIAAALGGGPLDEAVDRFLGPLELPRSLSALGVTDDDLEAVARQTGGHPWVRAHPRPAGEADVRAVLDGAR